MHMNIKCSETSASSSRINTSELDQIDMSRLHQGDRMMTYMYFHFIIATAIILPVVVEDSY